MKKIAGSIGTIALVGAVVAAGTGAFFTDTEVSKGNIFTAGAINIEISNITHEGNDDGEAGFSLNEDAISFSFADLKPLDQGKVSFDLTNTDNPAYVCVMVEETGNAENGRTSAEKAAGDVSGNGGELGQFLSFNFGNASGTLDDISGTWQNLGTGPIGSSTTVPAVLEYGFGDFDSNGDVVHSTAGDVNLAQTDSLTATISFQAVQARHNADYDCDELNVVVDDNDNNEGNTNPTDPEGENPETTDPIVFSLVEDEDDGRSENEINEANGWPYVSWEINGDEIEFSFHNPTGITVGPFPFEYRIDDEAAGTDDHNVKGATVPSGPYAGETWGDSYNFVNVPANSTETVTLTGNEKIQVRLVVGPERDYDFTWITFEAN